jgi:hypothetical protein
MKWVSEWANERTGEWASGDQTRCLFAAKEANSPFAQSPFRSFAHSPVRPFADSLTRSLNSFFSLLLFAIR